ncbi:MAG TPA: PHB depolymerase family esterase [Planctomycetota bacterium]|nr:PHB depolymerase family esterase [Planctomycetota bacterium]
MRNVALTLLVLAVLLAPSRADDDAPTGKLTLQGHERTWRIHRPRGRDRTKVAPLVFVLHGGGGTARGMEDLTRKGWNDLADKEGFVVVYPDAVKKSWNDGRPIEGQKERAEVDDLAFFSALLDRLVKEENVDRKAVFATGISNGGFMSHRLGRDLSDRFAAIAPVAANLQTAADLATVPSCAVSVLAINGTKDPLVPFNGGNVGIGPLDRGKCRSVADTIAWWVKQDGCDEKGSVTELPAAEADDPTRARKEVHAGKNVEVVLITIDDGGHTWPGGVQYLPERIIGKTSRQFDANKVIWEFFKTHKRP